MIRNSICIKAVNNLRNHRFYSKLYCQNGQYMAPTCIVQSTFLCKPNVVSSNFYLPLNLWRHQHQETGVKDLKFKGEDKDNQKIILNSAATPESLTMKEKLKKAVKEYGSTVIVFHIAISLISLGTCYLLVSAGLDVAALLKYVGLENLISNSQVATSASTFALAYAVHKVFAPARIGITLGSVPFIVRYLRKIGFLKK